MLSGAAVVIPVFNRATTVRAALDSVAAQTVPPLRLVVVDDGSTDGTADAVHLWVAERQPRFRWEVVRQENRGASAARNAGLARCRDADLIAFLDSDDVWPEDLLARATAALTASPEVVAATADRHYLTAAGLKPIRSSAGLEADAAWWLLDQDAGIASATVCRAALVRACGGFREDVRTGADIALFMRLAMRGRWAHLPGRPVTFRRHAALPAGEAGHLSETYVDRGRIWAGILTDLLMEFDGVAAFPRERCLDAIGTFAWLGHRELARAGRLEEGKALLDSAASLRFTRPLTVSIVVARPHRQASSDRVQESVRRLEAQTAWLQQNQQDLHGVLRHLTFPFEVIVDGEAGAVAAGDLIVRLEGDAIPDEHFLPRLLAAADAPHAREVCGEVCIEPDSLAAKAVAASAGLWPRDSPPDLIAVNAYPLVARLARSGDEQRRPAAPERPRGYLCAGARVHWPASRAVTMPVQPWRGIGRLVRHRRALRLSWAGVPIAALLILARWVAGAGTARRPR